MKKILTCLLFFILGALVVQIPDLIALYEEGVIGKYQKRICPREKIMKGECHFWDYYDRFEEDHPKLSNTHTYFMLGEGPLYWVASRRCTNDIFWNRDATEDAGKITNREYFWGHCSKFMIEISDLIYGDEKK